MSNEQKLNIEKSLKRGLNQAPALDFEKLAAIPVIKMTEHDYITRQPDPVAQSASRRPRYFKQLSAAMAGCMVMLACVTTWVVQFKTPDMVISLDANQSIEIVTNKQKQILSVKSFNEETQTLLDEQNLNQANLEDSVNVIISTMIKNGYLDDDKNVIMVSVENQNTDKANDLAVSLNQVIKDSATAQNVTPTVVMQAAATPDQETVALAEQYSVSAGKLAVIQEILAVDKTLTMDSLAAMSLTDLMAVSKEKSVDLTNIIQVDNGETPTDSKQTEGLEQPDTGVTETPAVTVPDATIKNEPVPVNVPETKDTLTITPAVTETTGNPVEVPAENPDTTVIKETVAEPLKDTKSEESLVTIEVEPPLTDQDASEQEDPQKSDK